jgi:hypothetical protein
MKVLRPRLYQYFAPLTIAAVLLAITSAAFAARSRPMAAADWLTIASSALAITLLGFYRWYFERSNRALPELARLEDPAQLATELRRWQLIHTIRTGVCLASFLGAVLAL